MDKVVMLCGPAGSGKSHYARELIASYPEGVEATLFSPDKWLEDTSGGAYNWTEQRLYKAWSHEYQRFCSWMLDGLFNRKSALKFYESPNDRVAIWDATFILSSSRSPVTNFAKGFGLQVEAVAFRTDPEECSWRNQQRPLNRRVPAEKIAEMIEKFAKYGPTTEVEGFDYVTEYTTSRLRPLEFLEATV